MNDDTLGDSLFETNDGEDATSADVLRKIEELWISEKMSPTLLVHQNEAVDCMLDQLAQMTENLRRYGKKDIKTSIHKLEMDRIQYIICSYLRTRLQKIEQYPHHFLKLHVEMGQSDSPLLSPEEYQYAKEYVSNLDNHLTKLGIQNMPENQHSTQDVYQSLKPNMEAYIFLQVKKEVHGFVLQDNAGEGRDEEVDLNLGDQHLMQYDAIRHLLDDGSVSLI